MATRDRDAPPGPRRLPTQQRSRARVERILDVARALIAERGSDALRMSEIAERAEISIGSLYQYFPDRSAVVRTLAERYNAEGQACTAAELAAVHAPAELPAALARVADGYLAMFRAEPVMRALWSATQADETLRDVDAADMAAHAALLAATFRRLWPEAIGDAWSRLEMEALLVTQLLATAVRVAIPAPPGDAVLDAFKRVVLAGLPERLAAPR